MGHVLDYLSAFCDTLLIAAKEHWIPLSGSAMAALTGASLFLKLRRAPKNDSHKDKDHESSAPGPKPPGEGEH